MKICIEYDVNVPGIADCFIEDFARENIRKFTKTQGTDKYIVKVSNELSISMYRILVKENMIQSHEIEFCIYGEIYNVDDNGRWLNNSNPDKHRYTESILLRLV